MTVTPTRRRPACVIRDCNEFPMMQPPPPYAGSLNAAMERLMCDMHYALLIRWVFRFFGRDLPHEAWTPGLTPAGLTRISAEEVRLDSFRRAGAPLDRD